MKIAVAGGTGVVGRPTVAALEARGAEVVVLARATGIDLVTGAGLETSLTDVDAVVDVTSIATAAPKRSAEFFRATTTNLLAAEARAGVPHHVALSIIGAARTNAAYYVGKKAQEDLLFARADGWTILRATQFHEFARQLMAQVRVGPRFLVPSMQTQPIAAVEVAAALAEIALGEPRGLDRELAGPKVERMSTMVERLLQATGRPERVLTAPVPGRWGHAMRDGWLLPGPGARLGVQTFDEWLAAT